MAVLDTIQHDGLLANCVARGEQLRAGLQRLVDRFEFLLEVRGKGLIAGVLADRDCAPMVRACMEEGLLVVLAGPNVLRLVPPLIVDSTEVDEALGVLERVMRNV